MGSTAKVKVKLPSGKIVIKKKWKKASLAKCAFCGRLLQGIPKLRQQEMRKLKKSKRRPERPYGGNLCSECMREVFREKVRKISNLENQG
ncbi:MAG: 50S ribosomal protein L34e [Candidatus Aenigmatarchaeota archaeon]